MIFLNYNFKNIIKKILNRQFCFIVFFCFTTMVYSEIKNERFLVTGTNIAFKSFFDKVAVQLGVKAPSILAGPFLSAFACNLSWFLSLFTGKRTLTKDSVRSAQANTIYSSEKLLHALEDFQFRSIDDTIENAIKGRVK